MIGIRQKLSTPIGAWSIFAFVCVAPTIFFIFHLRKMVLKIATPPHPSIIDSYLNSYTWALLFALLLSVLSLVLSGISFRHFKTTLTKWVQQILKPLTTGAAIGLLFISIYFFLVEKTNSTSISYDGVMATALGIYLSFCGLFTGFYGIFFEKIPILDIETLMDMMAQDLATCRHRLFWSFPGLSFGSVSVGGSLYTDLHNALIAKINAKPCDATCLVLSKEEIKEFYVPYSEDAEEIQDEKKKKKRKEDINTAIGHSLQLIDIALAAGKEIADHGSCDIKFVKPDFRHQIIIIDHVVYFLHSIGLPMKIQNVWRFTAESHNRSPVDFIATRISNSSLAIRMCDLIWAEYEAIEKARKELHIS